MSDKLCAVKDPVRPKLKTPKPLEFSQNFRHQNLEIFGGRLKSQIPKPRRLSGPTDISEPHHVKINSFITFVNRK
jgi:hypothetical protein